MTIQCNRNIPSDRQFKSDTECQGQVKVKLEFVYRMDVYYSTLLKNTLFSINILLRIFLENATVTALLTSSHLVAKVRAIE